LRRPAPRTPRPGRSDQLYPATTLSRRLRCFALQVEPIEGRPLTAKTHHACSVLGAGASRSAAPPLVDNLGAAVTKNWRHSKAARTPAVRGAPPPRRRGGQSGPPHCSRTQKKLGPISDRDRDGHALNLLPYVGGDEAARHQVNVWRTVAWRHGVLRTGELGE